MDNLRVEHFIEQAVANAVGNKAGKIMRGVNALAAKQGGENAIQNYQLLGKRALIAVGVAFVVVQVVTAVGTTIASRKREEQRIEQTVRRVLDEERARGAI